MVDLAVDSNPYYQSTVEEDPAFFVSQRTGRGPLSANWLDDMWRSHQKRMFSEQCHYSHNSMSYNKYLVTLLTQRKSAPANIRVRVRL